MFEVKLFNFSKKDNSTATPTGTGDIFNCILKEPSSVIDPSLILQFDFGFVPNYNYARIDAFGRYYNVMNWTALNGGRWQVDLKCDVLATYKSVIGNSTFLIERASADFDGFITDHNYPARAEEQTHIYTIDPTNSAWTGLTIPTSLNSGYFVLSVINGDSNGNCYYVMNADEFRAFRHALYNTISWYDGGSIADGIKKTIANPFQYLNGCIWFPMLPPTLTGTPTLKFGFWDSNVSCKILADNAYATFNFGIDNTGLPKHPQASTRGQYLNCSPYTRLIAYMQPWGTFEIDPCFVALGMKLNFYLRVDFVTGEGLLRIEGEYGTTKKLLHTSSAMFGVPIPITQRSLDLSGLAQMGGGLAMGTVAGAVGGIVGGAISSAINSVNPSVSQKGTQGSLASLTAPYLLNFVHYLLTEEDNASEGRPLMKNKQISTLSGFIKTVDADFSGAIGSVGEREELKSHLLNGFYYE